MRLSHSMTGWAACLVGLVLLPAAGLGQVSASGLPTSETALLGRFARGPVNLPIKVTFAEFEARFGSEASAEWPAETQARQFFGNSGIGGNALHVVRIAPDGPLSDALAGREPDLSGLHALDLAGELRLLLAPEISLLPADEFAGTFARFRSFLEARRIFFILDPPPGLPSAAAAVDWVQASIPDDATFCATYFPYLRVEINGTMRNVSAGGAMAAVYVKNDAASGIWRSPAGTGLTLDAQGIFPNLSSGDLDLLGAHHVNAIREIAGTGVVPWGARSLDRTVSENRFISVVRTREWIAASLDRALAFAATEDNGEPLWSQIRTLAENFLMALYQQGAFAGAVPDQAWFVRCDASTTSAADIAAHRAHLIYGIALVRPGEFDVTRLSVQTYDPQRSIPAPEIHARSVDGLFLIAYPTLPGFRYFLERSADLEPGGWTSAGFTIDGDGAWRHPLIPATGAEGFFRVRIEPAR